MRRAILILTVHHDRQTVFALLESGAVGYVLKDEALETLVCAVRAAARSESWLSPTIASQVVRRAMGREPATEPPCPPGAHGLTPREIEVLGLIALGYMNPEIAEQLVLSVRTVETHRANIQRKTGLNTRAELIAYAIEHKLVER